MDRWEMELPPNLTLFRRRIAPVFALLPSSLPPSLSFGAASRYDAASRRDKLARQVLRLFYPKPSKVNCDESFL